jgi:hypothetical protein
MKLWTIEVVVLLYHKSWFIIQRFIHTWIITKMAWHAEFSDCHSSHFKNFMFIVHAPVYGVYISQLVSTFKLSVCIKTFNNVTWVLAIIRHRHDIAEILLKVALSTIPPPPPHFQMILRFLKRTSAAYPLTPTLYWLLLTFETYCCSGNWNEIIKLIQRN